MRASPLDCNNGDSVQYEYDNNVLLDTTGYVYDSQNQLIRENNQAGNYTHTWTYDNAGNIQSRKEYAYTPGELGTPTDTVTYVYGDSEWGDLLTSYDGQIISSDQIGNITSDGTWSYTWEHGRELASMSDGTTTWNYTYDADGLRTKRTDGTNTYTYSYIGGKVWQFTVNGQALYITYDATGMPWALYINGTIYYYITNLQGDVIAILDDTGAPVTTYTYDAWGKILSTTGTLADTIGTWNPLRYRGYVYDNETGLYYVSSRYYDPEIGRWINADNVIASVGGEILGYNMFVYCMNNPVNMSDPSGNWPKWLTNAVNWVANALGITTSTGSVATTGSSATAKGPTISRNTSLGIVSNKAAGSLGYATGSFRGQTTQTGSSSSKSMIGGFGKASVINFDSQNRIGPKNVGISKKDVLDVGTVTAQAGIQYKDGLGVSLGAKASVAAARGTYCVDAFGWKVEVGMSAQFLSYGYELAYGALPDGGWGIKKGISTGPFGYSYLIRITPP